MIISSRYIRRQGHLPLLHAGLARVSDHSATSVLGEIRRGRDGTIRASRSGIRCREAELISRPSDDPPAPAAPRQRRVAAIASSAPVGRYKPSVLRRRRSARAPNSRKAQEGAPAPPRQSFDMHWPWCGHVPTADRRGTPPRFATRKPCQASLAALAACRGLLRLCQALPPISVGTLPRSVAGHNPAPAACGGDLPHGPLSDPIVTLP